MKNVVLSVFALSLLGCGGGSDSGNNQNTVNPIQPSQSVRVDYPLDTENKSVLLRPSPGDYLRYDLTANIDDVDYSGILTTRTYSMYDTDPLYFEVSNDSGAVEKSFLSVNSYELEGIAAESRKIQMYFPQGFYSESTGYLVTYFELDDNTGEYFCTNYVNNICFGYDELYTSLTVGSNSSVNAVATYSDGNETVLHTMNVLEKAIVETPLGKFETFVVERVFSDTSSPSWNMGRVSYRKETLYIYPNLGVVAGKVLQTEINGSSPISGTYEYKLTNTNIRFN